MRGSRAARSPRGTEGLGQEAEPKALFSGALVLASGSPRRREMLARLGANFVVRPVDIDESPEGGELPEPYVRRLAEEKARAAAARARTADVVLAADTIVASGGELLGKPAGVADARRMLERLSAREHEVLTGVAVIDGPDGDLRLGVERTRVRFAELSAEEIDWYVATAEPLDKAGAYAIQGFGALFVDGIDGNYSNVVGLPLPLTYRLLREAGLSLLASAQG